MTKSPALSLSDDGSFLSRHIGPGERETAEMLEAVGYDTLDALIDATVPEGIRLKRPLAIADGKGESETLAHMRTLAAKNQILRSYIGMGYYDTFVPPVVQRNILENPGWYTAYTPYQAEIAQGRLEALLNFQTVVIDLTGLEIANASLLDEGTAAAEAMYLAYNSRGKDGKELFFVAEDCHPQTIEVVRTRAAARGLRVVVGNPKTYKLGADVFGALLQYPATDGTVHDYRAFADAAHAQNVLVIAACDLLALTLLTPPGEWGADIAVGSTQRFGVPMGYGGPHAAFFATKDEFKRTIPGRIIGVSRDARGRPALRMALQTREQHIRREKATSNVCTAQVLLAVMASMYAVWHGPAGLTRIAKRVHRLATLLAEGLRKSGFGVGDGPFFDTIRVDTGGIGAKEICKRARERKMNLRVLSEAAVGISLDETTRLADVEELLLVFAGAGGKNVIEQLGDVDDAFAAPFARTTAFMTHPVFSSHRSETEMLRYIRSLEAKDLSLTHSMIPLGSCTMKLNATAEMFPVTWPEFGKLHPFAPRDWW